MPRILIVGAGGFGREVFSWAQDAFPQAEGYTIAGFLDDDPTRLDGLGYEVPILGTIAGYRPQPDDRLVMGVGLPQVKKQMVATLGDRGRFITLIHPTVVRGVHVELGTGCVLCPHTVLTTEVVVGRFVTFNLKVTVGHDARIGEFSTLSSHCDVTGAASIGRRVFLGTGASLLPNARVDDDATVGAAAVVLRRVRSGLTVFGNPAQPI